MRAPSHNQITLAFGAITDPYSPASPHRGVDFGYAPDSTIYMPCDATVTLKPNNGNDGNGVYFTAPDGTFQGLLHTSKYLVNNGASLREGDPVAIMGDTGLAFGVHLHWAAMRNGQYIDPLTLLSGGSGGEDMIVTDEEFYNMFRAYLKREPTLDEAQNMDRDYHVLQATLWNNGGKQNYDERNAGYAPYNGSPLFTKVNGK